MTKCCFGSTLPRAQVLVITATGTRIETAKPGMPSKCRAPRLAGSLALNARQPWGSSHSVSSEEILYALWQSQSLSFITLQSSVVSCLRTTQLLIRAQIPRIAAYAGTQWALTAVYPRRSAVSARQCLPICVPRARAHTLL